MGNQITQYSRSDDGTLMKDVRPEDNFINELCQNSANRLLLSRDLFVSAIFPDVYIHHFGHSLYLRHFGRSLYLRRRAFPKSNATSTYPLASTHPPTCARPSAHIKSNPPGRGTLRLPFCAPGVGGWPRHHQAELPAGHLPGPGRQRLGGGPGSLDSGGLQVGQREHARPQPAVALPGRANRARGRVEGGVSGLEVADWLLVAAGRSLYYLAPPSFALSVWTPESLNRRNWSQLTRSILVPSI